MAEPPRAAADRDVAALTLRHEAWQRAHFTPVEDALPAKRREMAEDRFAFLRGAAHLWPSQWPAERFAHLPRLLCVGDLHLENFGTWRDAEGRLVWGVNDLDEAAELPFANDLVRLATSVLIEADDHPERVGPDPLGHVLAGYRDRIGTGRPRPFLLEEDNPELRKLAARSGKDVEEWWDELDRDEVIRPRPDLPDAVRNLLLTHLPAGAAVGRIGRREAGLGSRERPRFAVVARWNGARVAREIKAAAPSALRTGEPDLPPLGDHARLHAMAEGVRDPLVRLHGGWQAPCSRTKGGAWVGRRLSPESGKITLKRVEKAGADPAILLEAMGAETANLHLIAAGHADHLRAALDDLGADGDWLRTAAGEAAEAVRRDHAAFRQAFGPGGAG